MKDLLSFDFVVVQLRKCKTAAQERALVQKESAHIRKILQTGKGSLIDSISKVLLFDLLGYPSDFAHFYVLQMITSTNSKLKKLGYLSLVQLLGNTEMIILATNSIKQDLNNKQPFFKAMALTALANICTEEMCRELVFEVSSLLTHSSNLIQKKALTATAVFLRKCPEVTQTVLERLVNSKIGKDPSLSLCCVLNIKEIVNYETHSACERFFEFAEAQIKKLVKSDSYDHILLSYLIEFISKFEAIDVLKAIIQRTRNHKFAVQYELAKACLNSNNSEFKTIGKQILISFLKSSNSNLKYSALKALNSLFGPNKNQLQNLEGKVSDLILAPERSIRNMALELSFKLIKQENIYTVLKFYLNNLLTASKGMKKALVEKLSTAVEIYDLEPSWHLDTVVRVCYIAHKVPEQMLFSCVDLVKLNPQLQEYGVTKLLYTLHSGNRAESLVTLGLWMIGDYCELLNTDTYTDLENLIKSLHEENLQGNLLSYLCTCLFKIGFRIGSFKEIACDLLNELTYSYELEVQQRSCEYLVIINNNLNAINKRINKT